MKKALSVLFIITLLFSLVACSNKANDSKAEKIIVEDVKFDASTNALPKDTKLEVSKLQNGISYKTAKQVLKNVSKKFVIYDITATKDNKTVEPDGAVKVTIPITKGFNAKKIVVKHITRDGALETVDYKISKDAKNIVITFDKVGTYAIYQPTSGKKTNINYKP